MSLEVTCYSGHTYAGRPTAFVWQGQRYRVERILKQWRSPEGPGFRLVTTDDQRFDLRYDETQDWWSLEEVPYPIHTRGDRENHA